MFKQAVCGLAIVAAVTAFAAPSAQAANTNDPRGNNGVIKINNEVTPDSIPNNHPHVSCTFSVDFYNYDKGNYNATVDFNLQAPTAGSDHTLSVKTGNLHPFIGGDAAGGGTDLDASEKYTLGFTGTPQAQQGYHVKVVVTAPGSQGSDKKQKVFWVEPCATTTPTTSGTSTPGQVLSESTNSTLPTELPNTGSSALQVLAFGAGATLLGYFARLRLLARSTR